MVIQREDGPCRNVQQAAGGSGKGIPYGQGPIRPQAENAALNVQTAQPARINGLLPASLLDQIDDSGAVRLHKLGILVALILLRPHVVAAVRARRAVITEYKPTPALTLVTNRVYSLTKLTNPSAIVRIDATATA